VVVFAFPQTDQSTGKLRPALVLRRCPGTHDDWLICMISSQLRHEIQGMDEIIRPTDADFVPIGLKLDSVIRVTRLAVVAAEVLQGKLGALSDERLQRIRLRVADWISRGRA
jgi:mRNA interferase MazF